MKLHTKDEIMTLISEQSLGVLATNDEEKNYIRLRVMYFGVDNRYMFYFMSTKGTPKICQIASQQKVSFILYGIRDPYDKSWELEINGRAEMLHDLQDIRVGLECMRKNNPFAEVALESGILDQFEIIRVKPSIIRFSVYGEVLVGERATIFKFDDNINE